MYVLTSIARRRTARGQHGRQRQRDGRYLDKRPKRTRIIKKMHDQRGRYHIRDPKILSTDIPTYPSRQYRGIRPQLRPFQKGVLLRSQPFYIQLHPGSVQEGRGPLSPWYLRSTTIKSELHFWEIDDRYILFLFLESFGYFPRSQLWPSYNTY